MRVLRYAGMPDARSDKAGEYLVLRLLRYLLIISASSGRKETTRTDQEYLDLLAKEFNSIPDRESAPQETQDEDQLAAMSRK